MNLFLNNNIVRTFFIAGIFTLVSIFCISMCRVKKSDNTLVVGMMSGWPPFMSINKQGEFEGFDIDVAQAVAQKLGKKLEIIDAGSLAPLFISLDQGRIDFVLSGLDITQKRMDQMAMVQYTGDKVDSLSLIFWNQIPLGVTSIEDLRTLENATVCYEPGSSIDGYIKQLDFINQKPLAQRVDMVMDIKYGKSIAAMLEPGVAALLARSNPEIKIMRVPLPQEYQLYGMGIAIKKTNTQFAQEVSTIINQLRQDGTLAMLEQRWQLNAEN